MIIACTILEVYAICNQPTRLTRINGAYNSISSHHVSCIVYPVDFRHTVNNVLNNHCKKSAWKPVGSKATVA